MESIFTVIVVILAALAVSDLIVGVSNDATNFLNSAIGSKVAPRYVIMIVASAGILLVFFFQWYDGGGPERGIFPVYV